MYLKKIMKPNYFYFSVLFLLVLQLSCASVTIELEPVKENISSFTHHSHYGLLGLIGSDKVDLENACISGHAVQIKNYLSFEDMLFAVSTAGLYTPKSTKIWCTSKTKKDVLFPLSEKDL